MNEQELREHVENLLFFMTDSLNKVNEDAKSSKKDDRLLIGEEHLNSFYQMFEQFSKAYTEYADEAGIDIPDYLRK